MLGELMGQMAAGLKGAGPQNRAAAAEQAYEANMDLAVQLGWAFVDRMTFEAFSREALAAPAASQPALQVCPPASLLGLWLYSVVLTQTLRDGKTLVSMLALGCAV